MKRALAIAVVCLLAMIAAGARRRAVRSGPRDHDRFVTAGGIRHDFHVYVPSSYDARRAMPLLLFFHGGGGNADQGETNVQLRATAEAHGFILVRPEGYDRSGLGLRTWNAGGCCGAAARDGIDHVGAVRAILDRVASEWKIDTNRVFATGHSNGAMLSYRLACELSDRITAVAPNAGVLMIEQCNPTRPIPVMHMHGDADTCMPINGGQSTGLDPSPRPPVADSINRFIAINHATATPRVTYQRGEVTCVTHDGPKNADVVLCTAAGGGHAWPGAEYSGLPRNLCGGNAIEDLDANEAIWQFFTSL